MRVRDLAVFLVKTTTVLLSVAVFFIVFRVRKDTPLIAVAEKEQALFWLMPCLTFFVLLWFCMAREKRVRWTVADLLACVLLAYVVFRSGSRTEYAWAVPVALGCLYLNLRIVFSLSRGVVPVLVLALLSTGIAEAVTGLMQLYGMASSNHSLFGMTGSFFNPPLLQLPRRDRSRGVLLRADSACRSGRSVGVERAREIRTVVESGYADLLRILAFPAAGSGCLAGDPGADCVAGGAGERFGCGMPRDARAGIYPKVLPAQEVSVCDDCFGRARSGRRVAGRVVPVQKGFGRRPVADLECVGAVDP